MIFALIAFGALAGLVLWIFWRFRILRSLEMGQGLQLPLRIEAFTGYGRPDSFYVEGRVSKDGGPLSELNAEFDLMGVLTKFRRNLRRFVLPVLENVPIEINIAGQSREATTGPYGRFRVHFKEQPILKPGPAIFSVRLHPSQEAYEAARSVGQVMITSPDARIGIITDVDDTIIKTHVQNKVRMLLHLAFSSVSDLQPIAGMPALLFAALRGLRENETNPIFYVTGSPANLRDKLHAFLRANRFPIGPILLTSLGTDSTAGFFQQRIFKTEQIRQLFNLYPHLRFILLGDNGEADSDIYKQISLEFPGRVAAALIYEVVSPLKKNLIVPLGQHRVASALEAGIVLYRKKLISREALDQIANEMIMVGALPESYKVDRRLKKLDRFDRASRRSKLIFTRSE